MALRWLEGFDVNTSADGVGYELRYAGTTLPAAMSFVSGRHFGSALQSQSDPVVLLLPAMLDGNTWIVGMTILFNDIEPDTPLVEFFKASTHQLVVVGNIDVNGGLELDFIRGATSVGTVVVEFQGDWIHLEIKVVIHPSSGSYAVKVNGSDLDSASSLNTADTASAGADQIQFTFEIPAIAGSFFAVDNIVVLDGTGGVNDDFVGEQVVEEKLPRAAGSYTEWTPKNEDDVNFENVDDLAFPDEATTYNATGDVDITDTFFMGVITTVVTVNGIQIETVSAADTIPQDIKAILLIDETEYASPGETNSAIDPDFGSTHAEWDVSPDTSSAFTLEEISESEFGYRSSS